MKEKAKEKEKKVQQKKKKVNDLEHSGQKSGAAAYVNKQVLSTRSQNRLKHFIGFPKNMIFTENT